MNALLELPFLQRALLALGAAAVISYLATPFVKRLAFVIGAVDVPKDNRRMHKKPIPRLGGLAIVIAFLLCTFLFVPLDKQMQGILLGAIIILVVGVLDDCLALPALPKFFAQIMAGAIVVMHGCEIRYLTNPFSAVPIDLGWLAGPVTVFWIVLMTNAVNFIDGLDGLAVGVSGISTATMLVIALLLGEESMAVLLAALLLLVSVAEYGWPSVKAWLCPDTGWDVEYDYPIVGEALLPEPVEMGDYALRPVNSRYWTEGNEKAFLELMLVAETPKIWLNGPDFADGALEAWDSRGNHYTYGKYPRILTGRRNGHGRSACQIQLYGLEDRPEWVELRHVYAGWTMRIELRYREEGTA